jgi:hypothetical protein
LNLPAAKETTIAAGLHVKPLYYHPAIGIKTESQALNPEPQLNKMDKASVNFAYYPAWQ